MVFCKESDHGYCTGGAADDGNMPGLEKTTVRNPVQTGRGSNGGRDAEGFCHPFQEPDCGMVSNGNFFDDIGSVEECLQEECHFSSCRFTEHDIECGFSEPFQILSCCIRGEDGIYPHTSLAEQAPEFCEIGAGPQHTYQIDARGRQ